MTLPDLTTLTDVKNWLGDATSNDDTVLSALISNVSQAIRTYTQRDLYPVTSYTLSLNGNGKQVMVMRQFPIVTVTSLQVNNQTIPAFTGYPGNGWVVNDPVQQIISLIGWSFCMGVANVNITYTAGFAAIPPDIHQTATEWTAFRFRERQRIGFKSKDLAGQTTAFITDAMPQNVKLTLNQYKKVAIV